MLAADTDEEAHFLATSGQQSFVSLRTGHPGPLPPPVEGYYETLGPAERAIVDHVLGRSAIGSAETVTSAIEAFVARTKADELMLTAHVYDHAKRLRSFEIIAETFLGAASADQPERAHG